MSTYYKVSWKNTKKILLTFLMFLGISVASSADESLMLHFTFDEADISAGVLTDVTGNGFDALLSPDGNVTAVEGRTGGAAFFATVADYAQLPDNFIASLTSFTISTWVKIESRNMWCRISDFGSGTAYNIFLTPHGGSSKIRFALKNGGGEELVDGVQCPVGQWVHIAVVLDYDESESKGILKLYMDGGLVGTNPNVTICPAMLPESNQNYLGKSQYADPALNGAIDDYRIYNRALSDLEILVLAGVPDELTSALQALDADFIKKDNASLQNVTSDLNLPTAMEDYPEVAIEWSSNGTALVDITGTVVLPEKYPAAVNLKATLTQTDATGKVHTLTKEFLVDLYPGGDEFWEWENYEIARWDFSSGSLSVNEGVINVTDLSENEFVGTVMNTARIRTIGETERFNVLDLGPDNGYFDMGEGIGEVMYALSDEFTMCGYFYIDESYTGLGSAGNFYWTFSNSDDAMNDQNGYIIGTLGAQSYSITAAHYASDNQVGAGRAEQGTWHHFAYVQEGTTGTIYIDGAPVLNEETGEQIATGTISKLPKYTLRQPGRNGTIYNWLGRSNYASDAYLRNTLLYDFRVFAIPLTPTDFATNEEFLVPATLEKLNNAYQENPDYIADDLDVESQALDLGDLTAVTADLTLPVQGTTNPDIAIVWKSSNTQLITNEGVVTRPDFFDYSVTLVATLIKDGQSISKEFEATVLAKEGTAFQNDLMVHFDFSEIDENGHVVDQAEKGFRGVSRNGACVGKIGTSTVYNVLHLGDSIGYFDMGEDVGKVIYNLTDYTISAYYRIDEEYDELENAGNFLWTFSNSQDIHSDPSGYIICLLNGQRYSITPNRWDGEQSVSMASPSIQGAWNHIAYVQDSENQIGTLYVNGLAIATGEISNIPKYMLAKEGKLGTPYNWIGRSCYSGDVYLRHTLVYDFRIYGKALEEVDFESVYETLASLDAAYEEFYDGLPSVSLSEYKVYSVNNSIVIEGLTGNEQVAIYNISGQKVRMSDQSSATSVQPGIYVVRIGNFASKVLVR